MNVIKMSLIECIAMYCIEMSLIELSMDLLIDELIDVLIDLYSHCTLLHSCHKVYGPGSLGLLVQLEINWH